MVAIGKRLEQVNAQSNKQRLAQCVKPGEVARGQFPLTTYFLIGAWQQATQRERHIVYKQVSWLFGHVRGLVETVTVLPPRLSCCCDDMVNAELAPNESLLNTWCCVIVSRLVLTFTLFFSGMADSVQTQTAKYMVATPCALQKPISRDVHELHVDVLVAFLGVKNKIMLDGKHALTASNRHGENDGAQATARQNPCRGNLNLWKVFVADSYYKLFPIGASERMSLYRIDQYEYCVGSMAEGARLLPSSRGTASHFRRWRGQRVKKTLFRSGSGRGK